jgi:hypothetical protein
VLAVTRERMPLPSHALSAAPARASMAIGECDTSAVIRLASAFAGPSAFPWMDCIRELALRRAAPASFPRERASGVRDLPPDPLGKLSHGLGSEPGGATAVRGRWTTRLATGRQTRAAATCGSQRSEARPMQRIGGRDTDRSNLSVCRDHGDFVLPTLIRRRQTGNPSVRLCR